MRCYIASGWFNEKQTADLRDIKYALMNLGVGYFSPKDECICPPNADLSTQTRIFQQNIDAIEECDFVIVNTRDKDMGSVFEAGVAFRAGKKIIYFCRGLRGSFNLMLSRSGIAVATDSRELVEHISSFMQDETYVQYYNGSIE